MDNLENKIIKQYSYDYRKDITIIITALYDVNSNIIEFYGHVKGYATIIFLFGYDASVLNIHKDNFNNEIKNHAMLLAHEYYNDILDANGVYYE